MWLCLELYGSYSRANKAVGLMDEQKRFWIKRLAAKQVEHARRVQEIRGEKGIPPWWKAQGENTRKDLQGVSAEHYLQKVEAALAVDGCPVERLQIIKSKCLTHRLGMDRIRNATTREPKHREELENLFREIESLVNEMDNALGFDLFDEATWKKN